MRLTIQSKLIALSTLSISEEAGRLLERLLPDIHLTSELVGEISAACREKAAAAANEIPAIAEQLSAEAGRLNERSSFFRLDQTGSAKSRPRHRGRTPC